MNPIADLWHAERHPIRDALYTATGESRDVALDAHSRSGLRLLDLFGLDSHLANAPDWVTSIDVTRTLDLPGNGRLCCGEGSYGSEGFAARVDAAGKPLWVIYLEESNPFVEIQLVDSYAEFRSSSGVQLSIPAGDAPNWQVLAET